MSRIVEIEDKIGWQMWISRPSDTAIIGTMTAGIITGFLLGYLNEAKAKISGIVTFVAYVYCTLKKTQNGRFEESQTQV